MALQHKFFIIKERDGSFRGFILRLEPGVARRELEQQRQELPFGQPQQQQPVQPEQQQRVPAGLPPAHGARRMPSL